MTWSWLQPLLDAVHRPGLPETQLTKHFACAEFACRDGVVLPPDLRPNAVALCEQLEILRAWIEQPIVIRSGYRTPAHNGRVKGAEHSQHLLAKAADIVVAGFHPQTLAKAIENLIRDGRMKQGGLGVYPGWVHYDIRGTRARWRFP